MEQDFDYRLKKKDDEINELKKRIEDMSNEFARMLRVKNNNKELYYIQLNFISLKGNPR